MKKIWLDGCFDLFHYGHANAIRQARSIGDYVVVGIHSYQDIKKSKSLPVLLDDERKEVLQGCRWVDEVVMDVPFVTKISIVNKYGCSTVVHGNDLVTNEHGLDSYHEAKSEGKFEEVERTIGISTTEIVGRMLLRESKKADKIENSFISEYLSKFALPKKEKKGKVIFIDGHFDLFHAGHVKALENARKMGDYLIVGLLSDKITREYCKSSPILDDNERRLVLLSNKYVDEIVDSPYKIDKDFVLKHGINQILCSYDIKDLSRYNDVKEYVVQNFCENKFSYLSADYIIGRIISNYQGFVDRQKKRT